MEACKDRVVHIADIHFWHVTLNPLRLMNKRVLGELTVLCRRRREFVMENAEAFADAAAATGANTAILTGDFTSTSLDEEFEHAARFLNGLRRRGLSVHMLPGNHDAYTFESLRAGRLRKWLSEFLPEGGYPALERLPGGTPLILVPTACPRFLSARGCVTDDTIEKVSALLSKCGPQVIVAAHYPVLHRTRGYASGRSRRLVNAEALRAALGASGKRILYLCGHVHRFSYESDREFPNIEYLSTGAFFRKSAKTNTDGEFVEIGVGDGCYHVKRHTHRQAWSIDGVTPAPSLEPEDASQRPRRSEHE